MQHASRRLDTAQLALFDPEFVARAAARFSRDAAGGDLAAYETREALLDLWQAHRGLDNRAQTVGDLIEIEIGRHVRSRPGR